MSDSLPFRVDTRPFHQRAMEYFQAGDPEQAAKLFRLVLNHDPRHIEATFFLGVIALNAGAPDAALIAIDQAIALEPRAPSFHDSRGDALMALGRVEEAMDSWRSAIALDPDLIAPLVSLGVVLTETGQVEAAMPHLQRARSVDGDDLSVLTALGTAFTMTGDYEQAQTALERALRIAPGHPLILHNLSTVSREIGMTDRAAALTKEALTALPDHPDILHGHALNLIAAGHADEAIEVLRGILEIAPGHGKARSALATTLMTHGQNDEGWTILAGLTRRDGGDQPEWDGSPLNGQVLLVRAHGDPRDFIQFCRFVPPLAEHGKVVVQVPSALARIALRLPGVSQVVPAGHPLPPFDTSCPVMGLRRVGEPRPAIALTPDRLDVADWRARLDGLPGLKVGFVQAGDPWRDPVSRRPIPPATLAPFGSIPGVSFIALGKGTEPLDIPGAICHDWTEELLDIADTAALIANLDLVISVDGLAAHLAGALGRPVWLLNRSDSTTDPRWMTGRDDSPWYPSMRIFRQTRTNDWSHPVERAVQALRDMVETGMMAR